MDGTFVKELATQLARPSHEDLSGACRAVLPAGWKLETIAPPEPAPLAVHTLTGFADYLKADVDGLKVAAPEQAGLVIVVERHDRVKLVGRLGLEERLFRRCCYLTGEAQPVRFAFGEYLDSEAFTIGLQSAFVASQAREDALKLVSSIKDGELRESSDDGYSQEVNVKRGVAFADRLTIRNPFMLAPFRTFSEVEQPASAFILRLRSSGPADHPRLALFEADGGAWRIEAIARVAAWLRGHIEGVPIIA